MRIMRNRSGLYFVFNNEKYDQLEDLIYRLNMENINNIKIEWYWDFNGDDIIDTINGRYLDMYCFEIALIR